MKSFNLEKLGIETPRIYRNLSVPRLYEMALLNEKGSIISDKGALIVYSGAKTGRSPKDRRIVKHPDSENNIDWGSVNLEMDEHTFMINKVRAIDYLNSKEIIYVVDGFAGWDTKYRIKVRIICTRAYHALFMHNMLIRPTKEELKSFGDPDYTVLNAGAFPANKYTNQMTSKTSIGLNFEKREIVGKQNSKLFEDGYIPAVVYNAKGDSRNIQITYSIASRIVRSATSATVLDAEYEGKDIKVIVKEIDVNPLTDKIRHIAFFEIDKDKEMTFTIPFNIVGIAPAVKNNLGILVEVFSSIDVRCKLSELVPFIEVDITNLEHPGQSISMNELNSPKGISLENEDLAESTVVTITELQEEIVIEEPEVEEIEEGEEGTEGEEGEGTEGEEETKEESKE